MEPEIRPKSNCGCGESGVKGRDERKVRALDTGLPTPTLPYAFFTAKSRKKCLDKADVVIHGQSLLIFVQVFFSFRISARILVSRFARRSRRSRISRFGRERRNNTRACWDAIKASMRPLRPGRSFEDAVLGCGARCLGLL